MSGKRAGQERRKRAVLERESRELRRQAALEKVAHDAPCRKRSKESGNQAPLCALHQREDGEISEKDIRFIADRLLEMRRSGLVALRHIERDETSIVNEHLAETLMLQKLVEMVGENAKQIDQRNCWVLEHLSELYTPWREVIGARDKLSHLYALANVQPRLLLKRVLSYAPFLVGLPVIVCYGQPAKSKGVAVSPGDMDSVLDWHKVRGEVIRVRYLGFLEDGSCFGATVCVKSGAWRGSIVRDADDVPVEGADVVPIEVHHPADVKLVPFDGDDVLTSGSPLVVLRDTPSAILRAADGDSVLGNRKSEHIVISAIFRAPEGMNMDGLSAVIKGQQRKWNPDWKIHGSLSDGTVLDERFEPP